MWDAYKMFSFLNFMLFIYFGRKLELASALLVNDFCSPKVTTPTRLLIPKVTKVVITLR